MKFYFRFSNKFIFIAARSDMVDFFVKIPKNIEDITRGCGEVCGHPLLQTKSLSFVLTWSNGFIITWILQQIFMFYNKWNLQRAKLKISTVYLIPFPPNGWTKWPINEGGHGILNGRQFPPCHNIQEYCSIFKHYGFFISFSVDIHHSRIFSNLWCHT